MSRTTLFTALLGCDPLVDDGVWFRGALPDGEGGLQLGGEHGALAGCTGDHDTLWTHLEAAWEAQTEELRRRLHERELDERRERRAVVGRESIRFGEEAAEA